MNKNELREAAVDDCLVRLLTNGRDDEAKRLVLMSADGEDLGGWGIPALREKLMAIYDTGYEAGKPKWIPVSERLPNKDALYIVCCMGFIPPFTGTAWFNPGTQQWSLMVDVFIRHITAWMPLPDSYTEGE